jgi:hypothetical protein
VITRGAPLSVPRHADARELETRRRVLEEALLQLDREAEGAV